VEGQKLINIPFSD